MRNFVAHALNAFIHYVFQNFNSLKTSCQCKDWDCWDLVDLLQVSSPNNWLLPLANENKKLSMSPCFCTNRAHEIDITESINSATDLSLTKLCTCQLSTASVATRKSLDIWLLASVPWVHRLDVQEWLVTAELCTLCKHRHSPTMATCWLIP